MTSSNSGPNHRSTVVSFDRRPIQHEIAVALHHEIDHLRFAFALLQFFAHLVLEIDGEPGVRIRDRLVLAHETAQLGRDRRHALFERRILRCRRRFTAKRRSAEREQKYERECLTND